MVDDHVKDVHGFEMAAKSTDADIKVRLRETNPAPATQTDLGELTWELSLDGGQEATVRYRFTVEHPAQVTVTGI